METKRIISTFVALIMALSLFTSCTNKNYGEDITASETTEKEEQSKVPDFYVYNSTGEKVTLYDELKKPTVINFWATWCPPCKSEMPAFQKLYLEYGGEVDFMMINLTDGQRDTRDSVDAFISENEYTFPVYYDEDMNAAAAYGVQSIPMTVFVTADGELIDYQVGAMDEAALLSFIQLMVKQAENNEK